VRPQCWNHRRLRVNKRILLVGCVRLILGAFGLFSDVVVWVWVYGPTLCFIKNQYSADLALAQK